jgi:hypothetical protein
MKPSLWAHLQVLVNSKNHLAILLCLAKRWLVVENQHKAFHRTLDFHRAQDLFCRRSQQTNYVKTKAPKTSSKFLLKFLTYLSDSLIAHRHFCQMRFQDLYEIKIISITSRTLIAKGWRLNKTKKLQGKRLSKLSTTNL